MCQGHIISVNKNVLIYGGSFPKDTRNLLHWRSTEEIVLYIGINYRGIPRSGCGANDGTYFPWHLKKRSLLHIYVLLTSHSGLELVVFKHLNHHCWSMHYEVIAFRLSIESTLVIFFTRIQFTI